MPSIRVIFFSLLSFHLFGCATIINGSTEKVKVMANTSDTRVFINDVYLGVTGPDFPLEITVPKRGDIVFVGKKEKCENAEKKMNRTFDPATLLGFFIDRGLISILMVDVLGTSAYVHADQSIYFLTMNCGS